MVIVIGMAAVTRLWWTVRVTHTAQHRISDWKCVYGRNQVLLEIITSEDKVTDFVIFLN